MADKVLKGKSGDGNKNLLFIALGFILVSIAWYAYEITRDRTPDEIKELKENAKIQADIDRANKKRSTAP